MNGTLTQKGETLRRHVHLILEGGHAGGRTGEVVEVTLVLLIIANVVGYSLQSVPSLEARYGAQFLALEIFSVAVFTVEYILRLWAAPEDPLMPKAGAVMGRVRFALRPMMMIDFIAIAPAYIAFFVPFFDLRVLRLVRLLRLLKIARYSPALATLGYVVVEERRALFGTLLLLLCTTLFAAAAMHAVEGSVQPDRFGTIPDAMWWAITTLTTVGYGDVVPVTPYGRVIAGLTMITGLGLFALPVGIIATGFVNTIHRRDFVVTLGMLARVPLFAGLDVRVLSDVMAMLQARLVPPGSIVSARGEPAEAVYLLVSGDVEVELASRTLRFGPPTFFGELNFLQNTMRGATVVALTQCRLLTLSAHDFRHLMQKYPELQTRLKSAVKDAIRVFGDVDPVAQEEARAAGFWSEEAAPDTQPA